MSLKGDFTNITENNIPEFYIEASDVASQMLLFQIKNKFYGEPYVLESTDIPGQNLSSQVIFSFGGKSPISVLDLDISLDNITVTPKWYPEQYVLGTISNYYNYDSGFEPPTKIVKTLSRRHKLFFEIPEFDLIKAYNPQILIQRYTCSNVRGSGGQKSGGAYRNAPRKALIPLTSANMEVDFLQEEYFRLLKNDSIRAKSYKRTAKGNSAHMYFQFKIQITFNGKTFVSNPVTRLMLQATYQASGRIKATEITEMFQTANAEFLAKNNEMTAIKDSIEESVNDQEGESLQKKLAKLEIEAADAKAIVDATEEILPGGPSNPQFDTSYFAISYRIT
ncbi:hypothetical protein [Epilithonimonas hominis]|uniref:hypothetical protein n=1 Tax=Epilithonimonas hominis TaxID=420404 RepID=UPI00289CA3D1|nr:hypothetical protein [Epilithonimonas hominis]